MPIDCGYGDDLWSTPGVSKSKADIDHTDAVWALRDAHRIAGSGDAEGARELYAQAVELVGENEVLAITEEERFCFTPPPNYELQPRRSHQGFASV